METLLSERRLVSRVLRHWEELAGSQCLPSKANLDPWLVGDDWTNCLLVTLAPELAQSTFIVVGDNLLPTPPHRLDGLPISACPSNTLLGTLLKFLSRFPSHLGPVTVSGTADHLGVRILYRGVLMPLSEDGLTVDTVFGAANYRRAQVGG